MLDQYRTQIDQLDDQIMNLLNQRAKIALAIAKEKQRNQRPVVDASRERQVIERLSQQNSGPLAHDALARIYHALIAEMRRLQENAG